AFGPDSTKSIGPVDASSLAGAQYYRLDVNPNSDVLSVRVTPQGPGTAIRVVLLRPDGSTTRVDADFGQTLELPVKLSGTAGPYDLYVAATSGFDPVVIDVGQLALPKQLDANQILGAELGLDGTLNPAPQAVPGFGGQAAVAYYSL